MVKFACLLKKVTQSGELTAQNIAKTEKMWIKENQSTLVMNDNFPAWKAQLICFKMRVVCGDVEEGYKMQTRHFL